MARTGKPPKPFVKGDPRINRKGRPPRNGLSLAEQIRAALEQAQALDAIISKAINQAKNGDHYAREWLSDRGYGKALEKIEMTQEQPFDAAKLSDDELATLKELLLKAKPE